MTLPIEQAVCQKLLLAFEGKGVLSPELKASLQSIRPAGVTLFRSLNIETPAQVQRLTSCLQGAARELDLPPLLIATDQEGGQLMAIGPGCTPLPGNMALGAAGSLELAQQAGEVLGSELAALGINVNYAPSCDVNVNPSNPVIGLRSIRSQAEREILFGEEKIRLTPGDRAAIAGVGRDPSLTIFPTRP